MTLRPAGRRRCSLAVVALLLSILAAIVAPVAALAKDAQVKLALTPIGQAGSYFDLTMQPGESRKLGVEIANFGAATLDVRTYAADVYTIINGGFGGRLRDEPQTDATRWLDYATEVLELPMGKVVRRSFTVTVPLGAGPGEYITSLVLENDVPIPGSGAVALNQIVRQAVAVVVTLPGQRSPALAIGKASHKIVAGMSIVSVAVENGGNVRLKPRVEFRLLDAAGALIGEASVQMDSFYARTNTLVELPLATILLPGRYTVQMTMNDTVQDVRAAREDIALVVEQPNETTPGDSTAPGLTQVIEAALDGDLSFLALGLIVVAAVALGGVAIGGLFLVRRRRTG